MARIGLSPYGNPVESGIDTMSKVMSMFNQRDQMQLNQQREQREQEDSDARRQIQGMTMQREQNTLDEQAADKPIKDADRETKKMQHMYGPTLDGLMARQKAWKPGDNFELTPEETGMIKHFADKTGSLGTDAESQIKAAVAAEFVQTHGADALPVSGLAESADIEHLGKRGIICPAPLRLVLEQTLGTIVENKAKLTTEVVKSYSWHELDASERLGLLNAIRLVSGIETVTLEQIDIVDFRDTNLRGMHKDGRELLAKKILSDSNLTLRVLVHEVAHRSGNDGEKAHVANIERIWSGIVAGLTEQR